MYASDNLDSPAAPGGPDTPGAPPVAPQGAPQGGTSVLERTETKEQKDPGDRDRFAHFVRKDRVGQSMISGQPVIALCGKVWVPMRDPSKYPVCPRCKALRDQMGKFGKNWPYSDGNSGDK
ncbi:DUF3039 domain-containing protein [Gleimia hominis]|uniref:DUF3039 domain-containing protein n=1 Tax=Gleimia hominis TaxID=595468 RepID=A0ABU3IBU3_9ACTO|nr:DUF3039 domain-containing protein [Gleimia hominis]MDT3767821.1 DUF3039 domain-containing protein [Gleimia hominis]WIK63704.1 DUF3039 domain-containing protein [Gleimia hominis]